jgi:aldehyde dehydrogenase (NAD+)
MHKGENFINGKWTHRVDFPTINPANEEILGYFPASTDEEVSEAITAAKTAFKSWSKVSRVVRADYFFKLAQLIERDKESLAKTISLETGKNLNESNAEVIEALHMCQLVFGSGRTQCGSLFASEIAAKDAYVIRKPKGVVGVISPWNFPLAIGSFWSSGPAIVEGNCVVHKPSELTPYIAQSVAELYEEAGFPEGVYNLVHGDGAVGAKVVHHPDVNCILFTGSYNVGQSIQQVCVNEAHKSCSCEMGSKSATIVFDDGNQDLALEVAIASAFKLSGQRCVSSGRILVQRSVYNNFCDSFVAKAGQLATGDPFEKPTPYYGPLISEEQRVRVENYNQLIDTGMIMLMGKRLERKGFYLTPHVYKAAWGEHRYLKEEVFGPHVALVPFTDVDEAISIYNDTAYGLALGVVTDDFRKMRKCRDECRAGMIYLNSGSIAAESSLPFGGFGKSGNGHKSAAGTYLAVTDEVAVTVNYEVGITWAQGMK